MHDVRRARRDFHVDGSGMTVCVLSDSVRYLDETKGITRKDVTVLSGQDGIRSDGTDKGEGTAMLEIIHSIAPGAKLRFATSGAHDPAYHGDDVEQMLHNIRALGSEGCRIMVDDREFYDQSPFQDDTVSRAVNDVTANGILYITSAGNQGNTKADTSAAWKAILSPAESSQTAALCICLPPASNTASTTTFWESAAEAGAWLTSGYFGVIRFFRTGAAAG